MLPFVGMDRRNLDASRTGGDNRAGVSSRPKQKGQARTVSGERGGAGEGSLLLG